MKDNSRRIKFAENQTDQKQKFEKWAQNKKKTISYIYYGLLKT